MTPEPSSYDMAMFHHDLCLERDLIARICCDNQAPNPMWWCECIDPRRKQWVRVTT